MLRPVSWTPSAQNTLLSGLALARLQQVGRAGLAHPFQVGYGVVGQGEQIREVGDQPRLKHRLDARAPQRLDVEGVADGCFNAGDDVTGLVHRDVVREQQAAAGDVGGVVERCVGDGGAVDLDGFQHRPGRDRAGASHVPLDIDEAGDLCSFHLAAAEPRGARQRPLLTVKG